MEESTLTDQGEGDQLLPPPRRLSSRERQKQGPMWGCVRALFIVGAVVVLLLIILTGGTYRYLRSDRFAELIRLRIEKNLESHLGRDVSIRRVTLITSYPRKAILDDVRIANAPGSTRPYFATARQVEITGGVDSFRNFVSRNLSLGRVDIRDPRIYFEVYPVGAPLTHNFPAWKRSPPSPNQIVRVDVKKLFITGAAFEFLDRRHDIVANVSDLHSEVNPTFSKQIYDGWADRGKVRFRIQNYEPLDLSLRGKFRYVPGSLQLSSIGLEGPGAELFVSGKIEPLTQGVYDLAINSRIELEKVRQMFRVDKTLDGPFSLTGRLKGRQGDFRLSGDFLAPDLTADAYELSEMRGTLDVTGQRTTLDIESGRYGGGIISGQYRLAKHSAPYPMSVDLRYDGVSLEKLFSDWNVQNTGLRGSAVGTLRYSWNKDRILAGSGSGRAKLRPGARAFGNAPYPTPIGGSTDFALNQGVITFRDSELVTDKSNVRFRGSLRIENLYSDLALDIRSRDFAELDRIALNFARSAGKNDYQLLGLGGSGTATGTLLGTFKKPKIVAHVIGSGTMYNGVLLGESDIDLRYDGAQNLLTFDPGRFRQGGSTLAMRGTVGFPDRGPSPQFDLAIDAVSWPAEQALALINLDLKARGLGTGALKVSGTPESGKVTFLGMNIERGESNLRLAGDINWHPGKGNVDLNLDIGARSVPVEEITAFLDLGELPMSGAVTGTLHLEGPKKRLEGAGAVSLANGTIYGEPVESARADLVFTGGKLKATRVEVVAAAGTATGEAEYDFASERFSYIIQSSQLDLSRVKLLASLSKLLGGRVKLSSSGSGTLEDPELVIEATLDEGSFNGVNFPSDAPTPSFYLGLRQGNLTIRGTAFDAASVEGSGKLTPDGALDGTVRLKVSDLARLISLFPNASQLPAKGELIVDLKLGGKISSLEELVIEGSVPTLNVQFSEHDFTAEPPIRFALRRGVITIDSFHVQREGSDFEMSGTVSLVGTKVIDLNVNGNVEAALLQLFVPDLKAEGHVNVVAGVAGTLDDPRINGSAEILDAQFRFAGFPQLIDDVTGTLKFEGDAIRIDSLKASVGGGQITAGGSVTLEGLKPKQVRLNLQGTDVSISYFEGVTVEGDIDLFVSGDIEQIALKGDVDVKRALYFKNFEFATSIVNLLLERRGLVPAVAASWQDRVNLNVHLSAQDTLAVKNNIGEVTGSAELDLRGTLARPIVLGLVTIDEGGKVRFQDNEYKVVRGTINFQNPFRIDPYFDITAEGRVQTSEGGPSQTVDLTINLTGTLDRIKPTFTADPPISDFGLLSLLGPTAFGQARGPALNADSASTFGQSLLQQSVGGLIGTKIFPFADSVRFDLLGADPSKQSISFEKRISRAVRAVVVYYTAGATNPELYIEWQLSPEWLVQFSSERRDTTLSGTGKALSANALALDGKFRRRYEGHWGGDADREKGTEAYLVSREEEKRSSAKPASPTGNEAIDPVVPQPAGPGIPVRSVNFRTDAPFDVEPLAPMVGIDPGTPYSIRGVQQAIETLFATGDFRDIQVDAVENASSIDLMFILSLNYRIGEIKVEGIGSRDSARRAIKIKRTDILRLAAIDRNAEELRKTLAKRGYLQATVDPETNFARQENRADVIFHVTRGQLAKVGEVVFDGDLGPFRREELISAMKRKPGKVFQPDDAKRDADRIESLLFRRNRRKADVRYLGEVLDPTTRLVTTRYRVVVGPVVKVQVVGVERKAVRRLIPFGRSQGYTQDVVVRATDRIVSEYQRRGHFLASADAEEKMVGDELVLTFKVNPGRKYNLKEVRFEGNQQVSDKKLDKVISTSRTGGVKRLFGTLFRRPTGITRAQLSTDRDALEGYYKLEGFSEVVVNAPIPEAKENGELNVSFPIVEGPKTLVKEVVVEGNEQIPTKKLPDSALEAGKALNPLLLAQDVVALQTYYADRGNVEIQVKPDVQYSEGKSGARVVYKIAEGPKVKVGDVVARGNSFTDSYVVLRKAGLKPGQPFSFRNLFEAQRDLYRLGIFQRVDIQPDQAGTGVGSRNLAIEVEEGKNLTVAGSIGFSSGEGARTSASVAHRNLFGAARYLALDSSVSIRERRYSLTYREPFIFGYDLPTQFTIYKRDTTRNREEADLAINRSGVFIETSRVFREQTRWSVRYEYRIVTTPCTAKKDPRFCQALDLAGVLGREDTRARISSITPSFFWDKRDDAIDPHRGFFSTASLEYAFPVFGSKRARSCASGDPNCSDDQARFLKLYGQGAWYRPATRRTLVALSGRLGLIYPRGDSGMNDDTRVPYSERFFSGGETSHRAFSLDTLGILDPRGGDPCRSPNDRETLRRVCKDGKVTEILPRGGNALILLSAEYRFPIFSSLGGAFFGDAGNVWRQIGDIEFGEIRYGIGTGIRYLTPVGPVRIDLGYKLGHEEDESPYAVSFTLGYAF